MNLTLSMRRLCLILPLALGLSRWPARGELPAPDNILYGTITLNSQLVTPAQTNVIVEARRTANGPSVASYRMGTDTSAGGFYRLKIPLEELAPVAASADASLAGDSLILVVRDATGVRAQLPYTIPERGHATRLDFGTTVPDSDNDGLPDVWELATFGTLTNGATTINNNGQRALDNYLTGSDPNSPGSVFRLSITQNGTNNVVSFFARRSAGLGYEGLTRYYALEYTTNAGIGPWLAVLNYTNILGNDTTVQYSTAEGAPNAIYRGQARLNRP